MKVESSYQLNLDQHHLDKKGFPLAVNAKPQLLVTNKSGKQTDWMQMWLQYRLFGWLP